MLPLMKTWFSACLCVVYFLYMYVWGLNYGHPIQFLRDFYILPLLGVLQHSNQFVHGKCVNSKIHAKICKGINAYDVSCEWIQSAFMHVHIYIPALHTLFLDLHYRLPHHAKYEHVAFAYPIKHGIHFSNKGKTGMVVTETSLSQ